MISRVIRKSDAKTQTTMKENNTVPSLLLENIYFIILKQSEEIKSNDQYFPTCLQLVMREECLALATFILFNKDRIWSAPGTLSHKQLLDIL